MNTRFFIDNTADLDQNGEIIIPEDTQFEVQKIERELDNLTVELKALNSTF